VKAFEEQYVFFSTEKGVVKKTPLSAFANPRTTGIQAILLDPDDTLIKASLTSGSDEIVLGTRLGMACRFKEDNVRAMGRTARGVRGISLEKDDVVVDMVVIQPGKSVLTICENGFGKRTAVDEYRLTRRGGKGVINIRTTERNGPVVALRAVTDSDALILITGKGILMRMRLGGLREIGRATQGVRLIRLDEGDRVAAVAKIVNDTDEPDELEDLIPETQAEAVEPEGEGEAPAEPEGDGEIEAGESGNGEAPAEPPGA